MLPPITSDCQMVPGPYSDTRLICIPSSGWNGNFFLYVHGYTPVMFPAGVILPDLYYMVAENMYIWDVYISKGYAVVLSSFAENGFSLDNGLACSVSLIDYVKTNYPSAKIYIHGGSMGGIIAQTICTDPTLRLAGCIFEHGTPGSFEDAFMHWGNARVVFDYYYPGVLPGNVINVPADLGLALMLPNSVYANAIIAALATNEEKALTFAKVAELPLTLAPFPYSVIIPALTVTTLHSLAYMDIIDKMGCQPYSNMGYHYKGSNNDFLLRFKIPRYHSTCKHDIFDSFEMDMQSMVTKFEVSGSDADPIIPSERIVEFVGDYRELEAAAPYVLYVYAIPDAAHGFPTEYQLKKSIDIIA